jgi:23S rRNA (adenine2503-C2)-methyltransferase
LAEEGLQVNLAVSLHAANDRLRDALVPINRQYPLAELVKACQAYTERTHRRVTFEVALIDGMNDSSKQAHEMADLLAGLLCHVNLIPLNPVLGCSFRRSSRERVGAFADVLRKRGIPVTVRLGRGIEIQAGCGQLRERSFYS